MSKKPKIETKEQQKWHAKTLTDMFDNIKRGQEYVNVVMQRSTWEELQYAITIAFREENMAKKKLEVAVPVIKEKSGKIVKAPNKSWSHDDIIKKEGSKAKGAKHEFELTNGTVADREKAAKVAKKAGEVKNPGKKLHSHELRNALGIKGKK